MTRRTLLIASVGSQVGLAVLDAIEARPGLRQSLRIIGANSEAEAAQNFRCDAAFLIPGTAGAEAHRAVLRSLIMRETPDAVIAGRDADLAPLAALAAEPALAATAFIAPGAEAAAAVTDKYATFRFAQRHGLSFAETARSTDEIEALIARHGFPLVAKPAGGAGSLDVYAVRRPEEARAAQASGRFVFQPFLDPPAPAVLEALNPAFGQPMQFSTVGHSHYSATTVVGRDGRLLGRFLGKHYFRRGETDRFVAVDEPGLETVLRQWVAALHGAGLVGPLNLQAQKLASGAFVPIELNARFTGSSALRALLGYDDVGATLDHFLWRREPQAAPRGAVAGYVQYRRTGDLVRQEDVDRLARSGAWESGGG